MEIDLRNARPCPDCRQCLTNADKCHYCTERDQLRAEVERLRGDIGAAKKREESLQCAIGVHSRNLLEHSEALTAVNARVEVAEKNLADCRSGSAELARWVENERLLRFAAERERDEASQLLRDLAEILNPHDHYDPSKLLGWARDTVERAREADVALAHAADLRGALEAYADETQWGLTHDNAKHCDWFMGRGLPADKQDGWVVAKAALARTPAQSLGRLKAGVLLEAAELIGPKYGEGQARWALLAEANELEATDANKG